MEKNTRNYYTVGDLIANLRPMYKNMQECLMELNKQVKVNSKYRCDTSIDFYMRQHDFQPYDEPKLLLRVKRAPNSPSTIINDAISSKNKNPFRWYKNNATYDIRDENGNVDAVSHEKELEIEGFNPQILLEPSEELTSITDRIKSNKLFHLPNSTISLNPYQILMIAGSGITLMCDNDNGKEISIEYDAEKDAVSFEANYKYAQFFMESLLDTKVPKYELGDEYCEVLDSIEDPRELTIVDTVSKRKEVLGFDESEGKRLLLVKKAEKKEDK